MSIYSNDINTKKDEPTLIKDATQAKEEGFKSYLAGENIPQTLEHPTNTPDINKPDISKSFTTRQEVMSRLNLMDENYKYTDTYTNYIQKGGTPLPGYEWAHDEILKQEQAEHLYQKVEDGEMSYDTFLMDAYGKDILATMGYDVTSVAYWQNKFLNNDFSNPFSNNYLMAQVREAAESYHQKLLTEDWASSKAKDTQLANILGEDLNNKSIRELFPEVDKLVTNMDDTALLKALHTGSISALARLTQDSDGTYYYLHTDGEVYKLDGKNGQNHGTLKVAADGSFEGIDLNNNGLVSIGRSTFTGFTKVFTGLVDLGAITLQSVGALLTLGYGDGPDSEDFFGWANDIDASLNDNAQWLVDSGYVDLNSKISWQDAGNFIGSMVGTIAGTMALAGLAGAASKTGAAISETNKVAGKSLQVLGTALKWQTGNIGTNKGGYATLGGAARELFDRSLGTANLQVWGRRFGAAAVANTKNMLNDVRKNITQSRLYNDGASTSDIMKRAMLTNTLNLAIDTFISGGMDDNQFQAYFGRDVINPSSVAPLKEATQELNKLLIKGSSDALLNEAKTVVKGSLKSYLASKYCTIALNSGVDFIGNILTGAISNLNELDENGKVKDMSWKNFGEGFSASNLARSAINTLWYSTRSQIKEWNAGLETIGQSHTALLKKFETEIQKATGNAEKQKALAALRNKYIQDLDNAKDATTYEGRILDAMDNLNEGIKKEGEDVANFLKQVLDKNVSDAKISRLKDIYTYGEAAYLAKMHRIETFGNPTTKKFNITKLLSKPINKLTGKEAADKTFKDEQKNNEFFENEISNLKGIIVDKSYFDKIDKVENLTKSISSDMLKSSTGITLLKENKDLAAKLLNSGEDIKNNHYLYLPQEDIRTADYKANEVALDIAADLGYLTKVSVDGETVYKLQPYFDQLDFYNTTIVDTLIHKSVLALTTDAPLSTKAEVIEDLSKSLVEADVSEADKAAVVASILNRLATSTGPNDKQYLSPKDRDDIFKALIDNGYIGKITNKDVKANDLIDYLVTCRDTLLKIEKQKYNLIDLSDTKVQKMLTEYKDSKSISEETYNKIMKLKEVYPEAFQNGNISKAKFIEEHIVNDRFKSMFPETERLNRLTNIQSKEDIATYFYVISGYDKEMSEDDFKKTPIYKDITSFAKIYDEIYANGKTIVTDNDTVYIDLTTFRGKTTQEFTKFITSIGAASIKNIGDANTYYNKYGKGLYDDMIALSKYSDKQGSLIKFNLKENPQAFIDFMKDFGYKVTGTTPEQLKQQAGDIKGLRSYDNKLIVLNVPRVNNIEDLKKELQEHGTILKRSINDKHKVDIRGNTINPLDLDRAILDQVELRNISPDITISLKEAPLIELNPFEVPLDGKYDYTLPIASAYLGTTENLRKLSGKLAGLTGKDLTYIMTKSAGAEVAYDAKLENYFICELLVDKLFKTEYTNIPLSKDEVEWLEENNYADGHKATSKHYADNIWKISGRILKNGKASYYLELKPNVTQDDVMSYIVSNNFNIHKLIPLQIKEIDEQGKQGIIDAFATHTTEGLEEQLPGHNRENGFSIFSVRLPWDDDNNTRLVKFINEVVNHKGDYNPLEGAGYTKHDEDAKFASFDEWYEHAKNSKDPYDIITLRYIDEYNNMIHNEDTKEYENHRILIKDKHIRNLLIDRIDKGDTKATNALVKEIKDYFVTPNKKEFKAISKSSTPNVITTKAANPEMTTVSANRNEVSLGSFDNIEVNSDTNWVTLKTVQAAIDMIQDIKTNEENQYRMAFYDDHTITEYVENDSTKLLKGIVGTDGYIPVQDIDEFAELLAMNYQKVADGTDTEFKIKESLIPTLKDLYGNEYNKVVDTIFKEAKKHFNLNNKQLQVSSEHLKSYSSPSVADNIYTALGTLPRWHDNKLMQLTGFNPDGTNDTNKMYNYIRNSIHNIQDNKSEKFNTLMSNSADLLDGDLYDALEKSIQDSRMLYMSSPGTSDIEKYTEAHNAMGHMVTTINTFRELKSHFTNMSDDELMKTAVELVNLHQDVKYGGETVNYFIVKDGSLYKNKTDLLDKYGSANLNDLLFNIYKEKDDLKGCTIIKAESQDANNLAALKMSYMDLDNNFNDFVTDLYHHFLIDNSYYLTRGTDYKSIDQLEQDIFGGKINPERIQEVLNRIPAENMSSIQRNRRMYDVIRERGEVPHLTKQEFFGAMKGIDIISQREIGNTAIKNNVDMVSEYNSNNKAIRSLVNLSYGYGNIDDMPTEKRNIINSLKEKINVITEDKVKLSPQEQAELSILKELIDREDAPVLDFITRNRSLVDMRKEVESDNIKDGFTINYDNDKPQRLDTKDLLDLAKSFEDNSVESKYDTIVSFDDETGLRYNALDYNKSIFNIGVSIKQRTSEGWVKTHYNIFVNYEPENFNVSRRSHFIENWIEENINKAEDKSFLSNAGYKNTLDIFKHIDSNISDTTLYLKPQEIKEFFTKYAGPQSLLIGYNTTNADIPWMKHAGMFDDNLLSKYTHVDVKTLSENSQALETKNSAKKDVIADNYGLVNEQAHSGLYDADVTLDIFAKVINTTFNITSIRDFLYKDLMHNLEKQNIKLTDEQLNTVLKNVDRRVKEAQLEQKDLADYFDYDKSITTDTVTAASDVIEYMLNKALCNTAYALKDQALIDNFLSAKALQALSDNQQQTVNTMWAYVKASGIDLNEFLTALRIEMKHTGYDFNSLLETLSNEARVEKILDNLGVDKKDLQEPLRGEKIFNGNPADDPRLDKEQFIKQHYLKNSKDFVDVCHDVIKALRFNNTSDEYNMLNDMSTIYSFRDGINPQEYLDNQIKLINTPISEMYREYLRNNYGDVDAVIAQSKRGLYDLVDALAIGEKINTGNNSNVITDSSMIVISPNQFENLFGRKYNPAKDQELYSQLLIHPADANDKILPRRVVVDVDLQGNYMKVPETVIEVLGSRDFDGDHLILLKPDDYTQDVLKAFVSERYKIHDTQEAVLNYLRGQGIYYDGYATKNLIQNTIGKNEDIINLCKEADALLEKGKEIPEDLTNKFINKVKEIDPNVDVNKVISDLWLVEKDLYLDTGSLTPIRFINNPAIYVSDINREVTLNSKTYNVPVSFSGQERLKAEGSQLINKYLYNFIDQTTGVTEKYAINKLKNITVENPWTDLLSSGIYGSNTVYKYFSNISKDDTETIDGLVKTLDESIEKSYLKSGYYSDIKNIKLQAIREIKDDLSKGYNTAAFNKYDELLRSIEKVQLTSMNSKELTDALMSDKMQNQYNIMLDRINITKKNISLYNELAKASSFLSSEGTTTRDAVNYNLNSLINNLVLKNQDNYNQNIYMDAPELKAFVITRFGKSKAPIGIGEDTVLVNKRNDDKQLAGFTLKKYTVRNKDKFSNLTEGEWYKAGTAITTGKDPVTLNRMSRIVGIQGKTLYVQQVDFLDNGYKITTDIGGKGVVNGTFSTDEDVQILLNKPSQEKQSVGSNRPMDTKETSIVIKDHHGNPITVYGYHTIAKAKVTEDTHAWHKDNERNVDALHVVMNANTINSFLLFGGHITKDGKLETNPETYTELKNSVWKPYQDQQTENFLGTYNKMKIAYIINRLSDDELQSAFNTKLDANKLRTRLLNNMYLATDKYTCIAYTLGKKFADRIDDEIGKRLFSEYGLSLLGDYARSRATGTNPFGAFSKSDIPAQTNRNEDGSSNISVFKGRTVHLSPDEMNAGKEMTNVEDYYLSPYDFFKLISGGKTQLNNYKVTEMYKQNYLPYSTFVPGTANMENGFRNWSSRYTIKDNELQKFIPQSDSRKTGLTTGKAERVGYRPLEVTLTEPEEKEINNSLQKSLSPELMKLMLSGETNLKGNNAKLAIMIAQLENLDPNSSLEQKKLDLSNTNKVYQTFDTHLATQWDEEGKPSVVISKNVPITGTIKELQQATKNAVWNYATYNAIKNNRVQEESLDAKSLNDVINKEQYKAKTLKHEKELEDIWMSLENDFYNDKTGEIKGDIDVSKYKTESNMAPARVLSGGETSVLQKSIWGRQGLKEDTEIGAKLTTAVKNQKAGALFIEQEPFRLLQELKQIAKARLSDEQIKEFTICQALYRGRNDSDFAESMKYHGFNNLEEIKSKIEEYETLYPEVGVRFDNYVKALENLNTLVAQETGEPLGKCLIGLIAPYKSTSKSYNNAKVVSAIKNALGLQKYNPASEINKSAQALEFDLWNSAESIIVELSKMHSAKVLKDTLITEDMLNNSTLLNKVSSILDTVIGEVDENKTFLKNDSDAKTIQNQTFDIINQLTGFNISAGIDRVTFKQYHNIYQQIDNRLTILKEAFPVEITDDSYTGFKNLAEDVSKDKATRDAAKAIENYYYAKMILGQSMIQSSPDFANKVGHYIQSLKQEGYCLVNAYGQKYIKGGVVQPWSSSSMSNLVENMEIAYNSNNDTMWNQFVLEKIISGEVYLMKQDVADYLESHVYTNKIPNNTMKTLKEISKWSSALQMALPSKILNRLISFTGFDYSIGIMYDPNTIKYMGPARRELLAAFQSKGTQMSDELREYMEKEGQPIGLTGKDPITFSEDISGPEKVMRVLNTLTDPLEFQNHLGRYAIYLAAKESFDKGKPNYGPMYYAKDAIDSLDNNADKAMMIMDYLLGSPGGFPELSKKTSGLMLYATFPMNFARTMGAYGMSLGKLFKEGFTSDNADQWIKTAMVPSMGLAGVTGLAMLITSWICDLFGIEEDEKKNIVNDLSTLDLVGTTISGSPQKSGSSMNPVENAYSMFVEPFTNKYNETLLQKVFGAVNTNITSHLNPAIKIPVELMSGYDIYGSSLINNRYQYDRIENGMRKVLGFFIGSNTANSIVDQYKYDKYNDGSNFIESLMKGTSKGIAASLGNQKTYKKDMTNYYNRLTDIKNYKYKISDGLYSEDVDDYTNATTMNQIRNTKSKYGTYDSEEYQKMNSTLKKMLKNKVEPAEVYAYIISQYNSGVSEATIRTVLNNNSIVRKLDSLPNKYAYFDTLSTQEYKDLLRAIDYENEFYPLLQELFPANSNSSSTYLPKRTKYYKKSGSSYGYSKNYYPKKPTFVTYYPNNGYTNKNYSYNKNRSSINKVNVDVSPQMGVWTKDYNKTKELNHWTDYDYNRTKPLSHGGGK